MSVGGSKYGLIGQILHDRSGFGVFSQPPGLVKAVATGLHRTIAWRNAQVPLQYGGPELDLQRGRRAPRATKAGPRDWRLVPAWVSWAATLAIAIGTVADEQKRRELAE